jgi:hypothetical protein
VFFELKAGIGFKSVWDSISCPACGETFDIPPVPGKVVKVLTKSE